ncbi:MAG: SHOCT domain-containing protein [Desulfobacterium sp.]|nr:SHOCT domain-containing protein [Desulfobacterium sp.]
MKTTPFRPLISSISAVVILFLSGCTPRPLGQSMGGWGHMMGYGGYGGMFMWFILIIIVGIIIYFVSSRINKTDDSPGPTHESPMDILKKRYARGEITKEEFERLKRDLKD